jgi:hypothetical protein
LASVKATISLVVSRTARFWAAAGAADEPHALSARGHGPHQLVGAVGGAVGGNQDLELGRRVVERQQVLQPARDHRLLVVGGDDDAHGRFHVALVHPAGMGPRQQGGEQRVAGMGPDERAQGDPEHRFEHNHG